MGNPEIYFRRFPVFLKRHKTPIPFRGHGKRLGFRLNAQRARSTGFTRLLLNLRLPFPVDRIGRWRLLLQFPATEKKYTIGKTGMVVAVGGVDSAGTESLACRAKRTVDFFPLGSCGPG